MSQSNPHIRTATVDDSAALARLGARNGGFARGRALVAHDGREIIGAIDLTSGAVLADQARTTPELVHALRGRRYQLLRQGGAVRHARFALAVRIAANRTVTGAV